MPDVRLNDIGTAFRATIRDEDDAVVNVSGGTFTMRFRKPDGTTVDKTATLVTDGSDGQIQYVSQSGDINQAGEWRVQGVVTLTTNTWRTAHKRFNVGANL